MLHYFDAKLIIPVFVSFSRSVSLLAQWVSVGSECAALGSHLALSAIAGALGNTELRGLRGLWGALRREHPKEERELRERLWPEMKRLNREGIMHVGDKGGGREKVLLVPHVVPFLSGCRDLKERRNFREVFREIFLEGKEEEGKDVLDPDTCPLFQVHLRQVQQALQSAPALRDACSTALSDLVADPALEEISRCEFHLRLLWGSRAVSAGESVASTSDQRHAKFAKVVRALAMICGRIETSVLGLEGGKAEEEEEDKTPPPVAGEGRELE